MRRMHMFVFWDLNSLCIYQFPLTGLGFLSAYNFVYVLNYYCPDCEYPITNWN